MRNAVSGASAGRVNWWRIAGWSVAALLWLLPLAAMQITQEVHWTAFDFVFAACLIGGVGLLLEIAIRRTPNAPYRGGVAVLAATGFLLIWINAAVGIIGDEDNPLNLLYAGVLAIALIGGAVTRFRARGMAHSAIAAAVAQALVGMVAIVVAHDQPPGPVVLVILHGIFVLLFAGSAWLFAKAAGHHEGGSAPRGASM